MKNEKLQFPIAAIYHNPDGEVVKVLLMKLTMLAVNVEESSLAIPR